MSCNCVSCRSRREAQRRWVAKNPEKKRAINARSQQKLRAERRLQLDASMKEVSDAELERRMGLA